MPNLTSNSLDDLDQDFRPVVVEWIKRCNLALAPSRRHLNVTYRCAADQNAAHAAGLSSAAAGQSPHDLCLPDGEAAARAADFDVIAPGEDARCEI